MTILKYSLHLYRNSTMYVIVFRLHIHLNFTMNLDKIVAMQVELFVAEQVKGAYSYQ